MALFTVQPETRWPHDRARLTAKGAARERLFPTVKLVSIPVHGANSNAPSWRPVLHRVARRRLAGFLPAASPGRPVQQRGVCAAAVKTLCAALPF